MKLFNRNIEVSFQGVDITPITKLRISFEVDKQDGEQFNNGKIRIYNLNASSRASLAKIIHYEPTPWAEPIVKCILKVGYGDELVQLISGDILIATNQRVGPDWITDIEIFTGLYDSQKSDVKLDYSKTTSAKKIVNDLLSTIENVDIQYTVEAEKALSNKKVQDYTMTGIAYNEGRLFLSRFGLDFIIEDDGILLVYVSGEPRETQRNESNSVTFKPANGLLGSPKVTRTGVEFQALIRPQIKILQRVYVESQSVNETLQNQDKYSNEYFVTGLKHSGDTHSDEWYTEITGTYVDINEDYLQ